MEIQASLLMAQIPNMAVERDSQKLRFWFPPLRSGCPSHLRYASHEFRS